MAKIAKKWKAWVDGKTSKHIVKAATHAQAYAKFKELHKSAKRMVTYRAN